jgi:spore maturation protein CgeB
LKANLKINRGNNNLFATSNEDWYEKMKFFINNIEQFQETGVSNIELVREYYSTENNSKTLIDIFKNI